MGAHPPHSVRTHPCPTTAAPGSPPWPCSGSSFLGATVLLHPVHRSWGTAAGEAEMALPWDEDEDWFYWTNHAVQIRAPPERVWPWLAQIGQERGGFYSDEWLVNLLPGPVLGGQTSFAGEDLHEPVQEIEPEVQCPLNPNRARQPGRRVPVNSADLRADTPESPPNPHPKPTGFLTAATGT